MCYERAHYIEKWRMILYCISYICKSGDTEPSIGAGAHT